MRGDPHRLGMKGNRPPFRGVRFGDPHLMPLIGALRRVELAAGDLRRGAGPVLTVSARPDTGPASG